MSADSLQHTAIRPDTAAIVTATTTPATTAPPDTAAALRDSVVFVAPFAEATRCSESEAPTDPRLTATARPSYSAGIPPEPRNTLPASDSGVLCLLIGVIIFLALNTRHQSNYLKNFAVDLFTVRRRRTNAFDENTVNETRITIAFIALLCVGEGILLYAATSPASGIATDIFRHLGLLVGLCAAYYIFEICAYATVATVFGTPLDRSQWIKGFNASQALLGLCLAVPALLALFSPQHTAIWLNLAALLYIVARMIFIIKGFRIFHTDFSSNIYFILYLCTLEIIPPLVIYKISISLGFLNL